MAGSPPDVPSIGLGTYRLTDEAACVSSVRTALDVGYRHVDTAEAYGNEEAVGRGIAEADVDREDIFLATKVLHPRFTEDDGYTREGIVENVRGCLDRLGVDRVDLLYGVHWPASGYDPETAFAACADVVDEGLADSIGVCNVTPVLIDEAQSHSSVPIDAVQVEMHPKLPQAELRSYCDDEGMAFVAYAPLGNGAVLDDPVVSEIAEAHGVSEARVSLAWVREKGAHAIPKASSRDHIVDNLASLELELDDAEVRRIDEEVPEERQYDPDYAPEW